MEQSALPPHLALGREAEARAMAYFMALTGATLLAQNFRRRCGEIDLIFEDGNELIFVEVRARVKSGMLQGIETLSWRKRLRLRRTIQVFLAGYRGRAQTLRVDVLSWNGDTWTHLKNSWL